MTIWKIVWRLIAFAAVSLAGFRASSLLWATDPWLGAFVACACLLWLLDIAQDLMGVQRRGG